MSCFACNEITVIVSYLPSSYLTSFLYNENIRQNFDAISFCFIMIENSEKSWELPKTALVSQGRTEEILNCLRQNTNMRVPEHNDKELEEGNTSVSSSFRGIRHSRNNNSVEEEETIVVSLDVAGGRKGTSCVTGTDSHEQEISLSEQPSHLNQERKNNLLGKFQRRSVAEEVIDTRNNEEDKKPRQVLISGGSLPEWTDEQLDELLSFDWDDEGSFPISYGQFILLQRWCW